MVDSFQPNKNGLSTHLSAGLKQLATVWIHQYRPDWRSGDTSLHLQKLEKLFTQGLLIGLTETEHLLYELEVDTGAQAILIEGAAMGLSMLDLVFPSNCSRWLRLSENLGSPHIYAVHAGYGMAAARLGKPVPKDIYECDPLLRWLVVDGYGFHHGYFKTDLYMNAAANPELSVEDPYAKRAFDQGLGRALWFISGGDPQRIGETIGGFGADRQRDLWSGVGLAASHAGLATEDTLEGLRQMSGEFLPHLAQGAVLAAKIRIHAKSPTDHTNVACRKLCGLTVHEAGDLADSALKDLNDVKAELAYEEWRTNIRNRVAGVLV